jgi:hypothetical protein
LYLGVRWWIIINASRRAPKEVPRMIKTPENSMVDSAGAAFACALGAVPMI